MHSPIHQPNIGSNFQNAVLRINWKYFISKDPYPRYLIHFSQKPKDAYNMKIELRKHVLAVPNQVLTTLILTDDTKGKRVQSSYFS